MDVNGVHGSTEMGRKYRGRYDNPKPKSNLAVAKDFIVKALADGPLPGKEVWEKAQAEGILQTYFKTAKAELTKKRLVTADRIVGSVNEWTWRLLEQEERPAQAVVKSEGMTVDPARTHHLCEDELSVTMAERKKWGIKDNEQVMHIRDPRWWTKHEPQDPARAFLRQNAGSRIIYDGGEPVSTGFDTILAVRPMEEVEKLRERERQQQIELENEGKRTRRSDDFDRNAPGIEQQKYANSEAHTNAGMIGPQSPSSGVALEDYIRLQQLSAKDIEAEERLYSLGSHYAKVYSDEEAEAMETANRRAGGRGNERAAAGKFFSLPPTIRPRNLAPR
jgi:hypothetical protein